MQLVLDSPNEIHCDIPSSGLSVLKLAGSGTPGLSVKEIKTEEDKGMSWLLWIVFHSSPSLTDEHSLGCQGWVCLIDPQCRVLLALESADCDPLCLPGGNFRDQTAAEGVLQHLHLQTGLFSVTLRSLRDPERASLVVTVISDNYLSATVVSYQKKGSGSFFVPFSLHVILSIVIYDRAEGRVCLPFSPLVFSPLLSQYPWPRRPLVTSHTRSPLGRTPGFTLTPVIFVIPGDFSFVLLCTHRAPGSSRPACFRKMR